MKLVNSLISSLSSWASAAPERTWASAGRIGWISSMSCSGVVPSVPATEIASTWPSRSRSFCAVGEVEDGERRRAERVDVAELGDAR